jgi:TetR/AcrR family transcriptional regulator, transcriptional repressor of bet genes
MPRPPAYDHEQLIAAAYDVLREHGPAGLSLRPIAARLGVSQPALFKRIGSKRALIMEMQRWATGKTRLLIAALRGRELHDGLRWLFRAYARQARSPGELVNLVAFSTLCLADPGLRAQIELRDRALTGAIAALVRRAGRPRAAATARALVALLDGVPLRWAIRPRGSLERALLGALDVVLAARSTR